MVVAAGRGERLRSAESKAFVSLAGRPLVSYALAALRACAEVSEMVLVVGAGDVERARRDLLEGGGDRSERVVAGGEHRQDSVAAALGELSPDCDIVVIHDGARPLARPGLVGRCVEAAAEHGAAVAALACTDTVKEVGGEGNVSRTLDRSRIWLAQTPQAFRSDLLARAHAAGRAAGVEGTDDASLVERLGHPVHVVEGDPDNIKITYPRDVRWAEQLLAERQEMTVAPVATRCGIGYDAHRFAEGRALVLGGVRFEGERGLLGHSDADVVSHAVCDALLGAACAGSIGEHFPDSDPKWQGASSLSLLARVASMIRERGWRIENVDAVVIAEQPRIAPRAEEMRRSLAGALDVGVERVSVKGKTTEGMGFTGRGEGIASQAIAALRPARDG